jgi:hypothetical protein
MATEPREHTTVVTTGGGGGLGWFILGGLVVAAVVAFLMFGGSDMFRGAGGTDIDVDVNLPKVEQPAQ